MNLPKATIPLWGILLIVQINTKELKLIFMGNLLYIIVVILVVSWLIGFIGYGAGGLVHLLLVVALVVMLMRIIQGRKPV